MTSALWRREFRGAQRLWWRQPWVVPLLVLGFSALQVANPSLPERMGVAREDRILTITLIPQAVLALWMCWVMAVAVTREVRLGTLDELKATPWTAGRVMLAKTFAPAWPCILAIGGLAVIDAILTWGLATDPPILSRVVRYRPLGTAGGISIPMSLPNMPELGLYDPWVLLIGRLGHLIWAQSVDARFFLSAVGEVPASLPRHIQIWLWMELPLRSLLNACALAALAAFIARQSHSPVVAVVLMLATLTGLFFVAMGLDHAYYTWVIGARPGGREGPDATYEIVRLEFLYDFTMRFLVPAVWLWIWWRIVRRRWWS